MQDQNINNSDDDILYYTNDNISFGITELNTPFTNQRVIQSPYLKAGSGTMTFEETPKPKKINYDDILNSFNLQMQNGQLVLKSPDVNSVNSPIFKSDPYYKSQTQAYQSQAYQSQTQAYQSARPHPIKKVETKQPSMKNENFYKYFKSHNIGSYVPDNIQQNNEDIQELTPEELREYRRKKFLEDEAQRQRIKQIKSKNMFFFNGIGEQVKITAQQGQTKGNMNKLFGFSNR